VFKQLRRDWLGCGLGLEQFFKSASICKIFN